MMYVGEKVPCCAMNMNECSKLINFYRTVKYYRKIIIVSFDIDYERPGIIYENIENFALVHNSQSYNICFNGQKKNNTRVWQSTGES